MKGIRLENLSWKEAEPQINASKVVVLPLGAAAKEHGLHLPLKNDLLIAEFLAEQILEKAEVLLAPTINYSFYPAFADYPGSISLSEETSRKMIEEIVQSLARFGARRFYVINTGISTSRPLKQAASNLLALQIHLHFTDWHTALSPAIDELSTQEGGSHADEVETSIMLEIAPSCVDMKNACKDFDSAATGPLSRSKAANTSYSPSGVWGDASLAEKAKGQKIVKCLVDNILADIEKLRLTSI